MHFRILGPLQISDLDERALPITPREQTVLSMLLLDANRIVPMNRLIEAVWDIRPPATAVGQIYICISALRRQLVQADLPGAIDTRSPGYLLQVAPGDLDLHSFNTMVETGHALNEKGRYTEAAEQLSTALGLWRGAPLADASSTLVRSVAMRLTDRRLRAAEESIDVRLQMGECQELVDELVELVAAFPLREHLRAQQMLALWRAGRRAEALHAYRDAREVLVDELGLEPGEELRHLEHAILVGEQSPAPAEPAVAYPSTVDTSSHPYVVPHTLPPGTADFTGRDDAVAALRGALVRDDSPARLSPAVAVVTGKAGVGKTALAVQCGLDVADRFPDGQLFVRLDGAGDRPLPPAQALRRLLQALGVPGQTLPAQLDDLAAGYRTLTADKRMLVILDDAADATQVRKLVPAGAGCAVLVTTRSRLTMLPGSHHLTLAPPDHRQAVAVLAAMGGARVGAEPEAAAELVGLCGRLPVALRVAAGRLAARPHWTVAHLVDRMRDTDRRLDELTYGDLDVRAQLRSTYTALGGDARRLLRGLARLPDAQLPGWVATAVLGGDPATAEEVLETLVEVHLVDIADHRGDPSGTPPRFGLDPLTRCFAVETLRADGAEGEAAAVLDRFLGGWLGLLAEADHRTAGGAAVPEQPAALLNPLPGPLVEKLLADPAEWYRRNHDLALGATLHAAQAGAGELCWNLAVASATLTARCGDDRQRQRPNSRRPKAVQAGHGTVGAAGVAGTVNIVGAVLPVPG